MNGVILRAALAVTLLALAFPATSFGQAATVGASSGDTDAGATVGCIAADAGAQETTAGATIGTCPSGGSNAADVGGSSGTTSASQSVSCIDSGSSGAVVCTMPPT
jgi:hypothetical protein